MEKLRGAVIGCRGVGRAHATGLVGLPNAELVAACDLLQPALDGFQEDWKDTWPNLGLYTNHREMLEKENLDIVTVATSDHRHADLVVDASNAGAKGIFCEKPMATNLADAVRMVETAERNGTILSIDHTRRFTPIWRHTKEEVIDAGEIGTVHNIIGTLNGPRAMLFRNGTHMIDAICYIADSDPEWVSAELEDGYEDYTEYRGDGGHDPKTEPSAHGYIHFANGVRGYYAGGPKTAIWSGVRLEIVGTTGYILIGNHGSTIYREDSIETIEAPKWEVEGIPAGVRELVQLISEGGEPKSPARAALNVVEIMIGFLESQRQGNGKVTLPNPRT